METTYRVDSYIDVQMDMVKSFENGEKFRVIVYCAYDAFGLVGYEKNGIAVLDENAKQVVADEIEKASSGYLAPTPEQKALFNDIAKMSWEVFQAFVNGCKRLRYQI